MVTTVMVSTMSCCCFCNDFRMKYSLQSFWSTYLFFSLALLWHYGEARVLTEAQPGPLYRVAGYPLAISCNVSGFASATTVQQFEFRIYKPSMPTFEINIISTVDPSFAYAVYSKRVTSNDITLKHVSPTSVLFEIQSLEKNDEGDYECSVINSESVYNGIYSAKTTVKVIDNSLSVSSLDSASLSYKEGDALTLTCQVSSNTVQHTHLSVAWYLNKDDKDNPQPIISLDRDFTLSPSQGFQGRYQTGLITLDKVGEVTYRLKMSQVELSDQGKIYCRADEWIQDPDRSWYSIAQKDGRETMLLVKAKEVMADTTSLVVGISAQQTTLQEGQELSLFCNIATQNLEERFFSVAWLRGSVELARIGPTGVLSLGPEYSDREKEGELRAVRIGIADYHLILQPVRTEDQGEYICRAWPQERGQNGAFTQGAAQDSSSQSVSISATESGLSVDLQPATVNEGDRLTLTCKVQGCNGQLSITWQRKTVSTSSVAFSNVIGLSQEGIMEKARDFINRKVKAMRPATDTFTLELDEVTHTDAAVYQCTVSEWKGNTKTNSQSQSAPVTVALTESFVKVSLISRNTRVTVGENVELICRVKAGSRLPITLTWSVQRDASTVDNILTLYAEGAISWSGDQRRYQLKVESKPNEVYYYLLINGASHRESGIYQCGVSVFLKNVHKKLPPSNVLAVMVEKPETRLILTSTPALTRNINTAIEIKCSVASAPSASSRYAVTWLLQQKEEKVILVSSDKDSLVTFGPQIDRQRITMMRTKGPNFELTIRQARLTDNGSYTCEVVEWLENPIGEQYQLSPVSRTTDLTLIEPDNDLQLNMHEQQVIVSEGDEVELKCNLTSGAFSASFFYKVTWLYTGHDSSAVTASLVELDHTGLLRYPKNQELQGLQRRLRLSRPTQSSFCLGIQRSHERDSGTYRCQVEQYQLDHESHWQQKASESGGSIMLSVKVPEKKLSIEGTNVTLNVSGDFTIPCHITRNSSIESKFQVTWFWQDREMETKQHSIFTFYPNTTLQDKFGKGDHLRFSHPLPNQFDLAVINPVPEDSGFYFCEVEEWLLSLSQGWRMVAIEKSGYLIVNVYREGDVDAASGCKSDTWMQILLVIVVCSLIVIFLLVVIICRGKRSADISNKSLWAEQHPLNIKSSAEA